MLEELIKKFEQRSISLKWWAQGFLAIVAILLGFGVYIFFVAPSVTAGDIGGKNFDQRLAATDLEVQNDLKASDELSKLVAAEDVKCNLAYHSFFDRWATLAYSGSVENIQFDGGTLPDGNEIASRLATEIAKHDDSPLAFQLLIGPCGGINLIFDKRTFAEVIATLRGKTFDVDYKKIVSDEADMTKLQQRIGFLRAVSSTIFTQKVQAEAVGSNTSLPAAPSDSGNDLLLRLLQTSITRFGVLAVVGFLVSILVSLYRYNIRLAAFYTARADVLRLKTGEMTVSDFAILAAALSPNLEFGKSPQPPLSQLVDLLKTVKDAK